MRQPSQASIEQAAQQQLELIKQFAATRLKMRQEIAKRIVGQTHVLDDLLTTIFAQGHALLIGVPGLAKTLMVQTIAEILELQFSRIQFTPDLMPADITGTEVLEEDRTTGKRMFRFVKGPVFANIVLADEINRTPPKTQAALLEATQNPIEQEGTYPLPEAQLDRFMFALRVDYPSAEEELTIAKTTTGSHLPELKTLLNREQVLHLQSLVRRVPVSDHVAGFAVKLSRATRPAAPEASDFVRKYVGWGAGPRAVQYLVLGAKARAIMNGTTNVSCDHIREVAPLVLRHRVLTNFAAEADGIDADLIVERLLKSVAEA
jgi:MoxR-like ATPase